MTYTYALVILVVLAAGALVAWYIEHRVTKHVLTLMPPSVTPPAPPTTTPDTDTPKKDIPPGPQMVRPLPDGPPPEAGRSASPTPPEDHKDDHPGGKP